MFYLRDWLRRGFCMKTSSKICVSRIVCLSFYHWNFDSRLIRQLCVYKRPDGCQTAGFCRKRLFKIFVFIYFLRQILPLLSFQFFPFSIVHHGRSESIQEPWYFLGVLFLSSIQHIPDESVHMFLACFIH